MCFLVSLGLFDEDCVGSECPLVVVDDGGRILGRDL